VRRYHPEAGLLAFAHPNAHPVGPPPRHSVCLGARGARAATPPAQKTLRDPTGTAIAIRLVSRPSDRSGMSTLLSEARKHVDRLLRTSSIQEDDASGLIAKCRRCLDLIGDRRRQ
jgi:hypothetical protein